MTDDIDDLLARLGMRIWNSDVDEALGFEATDTIRTLRADYSELMTRHKAVLNNSITAEVLSLRAALASEAAARENANQDAHDLRAALAGRDATIAAALEWNEREGWNGPLRRLLAASPTDALAADRARVWEEGWHSRWDNAVIARHPQNPYTVKKVGR